MRVLVVGAGGREHALASRLAGESGVEAIVCAPGNPGMSRVATIVPVDPADPEALLAIADRERIDFTIVGPELPLNHGVVDRFHAEGRRIFGPSRAAAQLECSKAFAKDFMARHGIPTARYRVCADAASARGVIASGEFGFPLSSRPTVSPPVKASSWPQQQPRRSARFTRPWKSSSSATRARRS